MRCSKRPEKVFYDTVASRKYVDGRLHTFQSTQERDAERQKSKAVRDAQLAESAQYLAALEDGGIPTTRLTRSNHREAGVEEVLPAVTPRSSMKKVPAYSTLPEKASGPAPEAPASNPQGMEAM
jgi:hypothetical protein